MINKSKTRRTWTALTTKQIATIKAAYAKGAGAYQLAEKYKVSAQTIYNYLKRK